jgi:stringent starvation protein B
MKSQDASSTRPYLIRALYEWCTYNGFTPYLVVRVDDTVQVPREHVKNGEIVLNISFDATSSLKLGNDLIEFKARFAGAAREIMVPVSRVIAIYARENGQGMAFPDPDSVASLKSGSAATLPTTTCEPNVTQTAPGEPCVVQLLPTATLQPDGQLPPAPPRPPTGPRPALKRVK